jgi:hydroxylamine reductase (hybrid-cluster protein)
VREDGKVFMGYTNHNKNEWWSTIEYLQKERERCKNSARKLRKDNPEYKKKYYADNKEKYCEYSRIWRCKNPEKQKQQWKNYKENNREKVLAGYKKYAKENKHLINAKASRKRAMLKSAIHPEHNPNHDKILAHIAKIIKPIEILHIDHIIPLAKNGIHHIYNLRLLPEKINISKQDRLDSEMPEEIQKECYFWKIMTRFLTCSYEYHNKIN